MNEVKKLALETAFKYTKHVLVDDVLADAQKIENFLMGNPIKSEIIAAQGGYSDDARKIFDAIACSKDEKKFITEYCTFANPFNKAELIGLPENHAHYLDTIQKERRVLIVDQRGTGLSTLMCAHVLHDALFSTDRTTMIMAPTYRQATDIMERIQFMYLNLPEAMKTRVKHMHKDALVFHHGSQIVARTASDDACCGLPCTTILIDDAAHISWNRADAVWASILPCVATGGKIIITSTNESGKIAMPEGMIKHALAAEGFVKLGSNFE